MKSRSVVVVLGLILAGCGTAANNADVATGISLAGQQPVADDSGVAVVPNGPDVTAGGRRVFGFSCKNKLWDPPPSEANALALMKRQARELGYNSVHSVEVKPDGAALAKNCWSAISATGVAFNAR